MKSVLFVSLGFYDYDKKIEEEIKSLGYEVDQFTPIGKYTTVQKLFNAAVKGRFLKRKAYDRQKKYMNDNPKKYDYVLVIVGRHLNPKLLEEYRRMQPDARFILYLWDDVKRVEGYDKNHKFYDYIYTFDTNDAERYKLIHLPLFYTDAHVYKGEKKQYTLTLAGLLHSDRLAVWDKIMSSCKLNEKDCFLYLLGTKMSHFFKAYLPVKDKWMKPRYIRIHGMSFTKMAEVTKKTKVSLDVQFGSQTGLTLRTFETLAAHTKLITANPYVKQYDFYKYGNICVIDKDNPVIPEDFFTTDYNEVPTVLVEKYSLTNWLKTMLH